VPDELKVVLGSMLPIGELRLAIPLAIRESDLSWPVVFVLAVIGNLLPVPFIVAGLRTVGRRIEDSPSLLGRMLRWRTERMQRTWGDRIRRNGFLGILLIVAIPLPFTGAWTGSLAVWALQVPLRRGLPAIAVGVVIAGIIVTALTQAGFAIV
jgi:uncharacterized membrane protein